MQDRIVSFRKQVREEKIWNDTMDLVALEYKQTFPCYHASAQRAYELLGEYGFTQREKITFPADGVTAYQDKITPLGWEASLGKAAVIKGAGFAEGEVIADYEVHPFHLIKGSTSTKEGGEEIPLYSYEDLLAGKDVRGGLIINPPGNVLFTDLKKILDAGGRGAIADYSIDPEGYPDGITWYNAFTERSNWHVVAGDRDFIAFGVSPAMGKRLRNALKEGKVLLKVESNGRRFESTVDVVTGLVPGKRKEEFWIFAHLYEPLSNDNSSGVMAAMETARLIMEKGTPEFSLRVIFGLEMYGFAAYASTRGENLSSQVIGGIDFDAMYLRKEWGINCNASSPTVPFYGNCLFEILTREMAGMADMPEVVYKRRFPLMYEDDTFLGDSTTGVPTLWPIRTGKRLWHNSLQIPSYVEKDAFADGCAIHTAIVDAIINPEEKYLQTALDNALAALEEEKQFFLYDPKGQLKRRYEILAQDLASFARFFPEEKVAPLLAELEAKWKEMDKGLASGPPPSSKTREEAAKLIPKRLTVGLPYDLAKIPMEERTPIKCLYTPLAGILSAMDGKKTLEEAVESVEFETGNLIPEKDLERMIRDIRYIASYGYISLEKVK